MTEKRLGIIMNGVTGRMGTNQHLVRSILAIRAAGGVADAVQLPEGLSRCGDPGDGCAAAEPACGCG